MANISLRGLLTCFVYLVFAAWTASVHSYPTTLSNTTQILEKRVLLPPIPPISAFVNHLKPFPPGKQYVFYGGGTQLAASHYARRVGGGLMADADDGEGWATFEGGPFETRNELLANGIPTWNDQELGRAVQTLSNAYARIAEGDVVVVLAYDMPDRPSYWPGEYETLTHNDKVRKILAFDMKDPTAEPQGEPRELFPEPKAKTEHAG
ncbi:hypothetical protein DPV78_012918 [Talaromyces pinophilus]|nr:hypothetical protein DPV78_012918 [Talaromyces pinophilus]